MENNIPIYITIAYMGEQSNCKGGIYFETKHKMADELDGSKFNWVMKGNTIDISVKYYIRDHLHVTVISGKPVSDQYRVELIEHVLKLTKAIGVKNGLRTVY